MASQKNKWDSSPHYKYFYAFPAMKMFPPYRAKHLQHMGFRGTTSSPEKSKEKRYFNRCSRRWRKMQLQSWYKDYEGGGE